jgi:hypothetical protein
MSAIFHFFTFSLVLLTFFQCQNFKCLLSVLFPYKKKLSHWHAHLRGFVGETFELFQRERFRFPCQLLRVLNTLRIA